MHFSIVKLRGRTFFVRLQLVRRGASGRVLCSHSCDDDLISYHRFLQCCGLAAQREQLARWSMTSSPVFRSYFQGCKVRWTGRIRSVLETDDGNVEVAVHMEVRGSCGDPICLLLEKALKNQGPRLEPGLWISFRAEILSQGGRFLWHTFRALQPVVLVEGPESTEDWEDEILEVSSEEFQADYVSHEATRKRALPVSDGEEETESRLCVVCQDVGKTHALIPCGHFCLCEHCAEHIVRQSPRVCPLCRRAVRSVVRIWE